MAQKVLYPSLDYGTNSFGVYPPTSYGYDVLSDGAEDSFIEYINDSSSAASGYYNCYLAGWNGTQVQSINSICVYFDAYYSGISNPTFYININAMTYPYTEDYVTDTSINTYGYGFATNPATGLPWTQTEISNLIVGIKMTVDPQSSVYISDLWVVVDYVGISTTVSAVKAVSNASAKPPIWNSNINLVGTVATLRPSATFSNLGFTPMPSGYAHEVLADNNSSTYLLVFGDAPMVTDTYDGYLSGWNITSPIAISNVTVTINAGYSGTSIPFPPNYTLRLNGIDSYSANFPAKTTSNYSQTFTTNPSTGLPWTSNDISSLMVGVSSTVQSGVTVNIYELTVTVSYSSASSKALAPTVQYNYVVPTVKSVSNSSAIVPVVSGTGNITPVKSISNSSAIVPVVGVIANITSVKATSSSSAIVPVVSGTANITSVKASTSSSLIAPTLRIDSLLGAIKSTSSAIAVMPYINLYRRTELVELTMSPQYTMGITLELSSHEEMLCNRTSLEEMSLVKQYQQEMSENKALSENMTLLNSFQVVR